MEIKGPYLLFLGDETDPKTLKVAQGLAYWRPESCVGQFRLAAGAAGVALPDVSIRQAVVAGAQTMIVGVANMGGVLPNKWVDTIIAALEAGLDVASGMHMRLGDVPAILAAAQSSGRALIDVREPPAALLPGNGQRRNGKRLLTVGTDCTVGKMYTSLALQREMQSNGIDARFRATGQTGILVAGDGISVDAVVADFISGAAECLSPANVDEHWDIVEGQGSLFHPSYAGVSLGLLHGTQADALVVCHDVARTEMEDVQGFSVPSLEETIATNLALGRRTNPDMRCVGISVNTSSLSSQAATEYLRDTERRLEIPCCDPVRSGVAKIVANLALEGHKLAVEG
ncbi:MAG: DUF1611 domain-containing protein [Gammaproteobacteria bacterium]|nr:MAG: DUF1611 domain-containing protein [Gammaproteobacteria bacterium]